MVQVLCWRHRQTSAKHSTFCPMTFPCLPADNKGRCVRGHICMWHVRDRAMLPACCAFFLLYHPMCLAERWNHFVLTSRRCAAVLFTVIYNAIMMTNFAVCALLRLWGYGVMGWASVGQVRGHLRLLAGQKPPLARSASLSDQGPLPRGCLGPQQYRAEPQAHFC